MLRCVIVKEWIEFMTGDRGPPLALNNANLLAQDADSQQQREGLFNSSSFQLSRLHVCMFIGKTRLGVNIIAGIAVVNLLTIWKNMLFSIDFCDLQAVTSMSVLHMCLTTSRRH